MQANEILHHKLTLNGYLSQFTGQTIEQMTKDTDRDFFMSPQVPFSPSFSVPTSLFTYRSCWRHSHSGTSI